MLGEDITSIRNLIFISEKVLGFIPCTLLFFKNVICDLFRDIDDFILNSLVFFNRSLQCAQTGFDPTNF